MRAEYVEAVLDVVALIPSGRVLSYGDVAALLESGGPRQVGSVMSHHGSAVPWWRVIRAGGAPPLCHDATALLHYRREGTALRGLLEAGTTPAGTTAAALALGASPAAPAGTASGRRGPSWKVDMAAARWNPSEADFDAIDAVAARLHAALEPGTEPGPATATEPGLGPAPADAEATMSEPRDGLDA